MPFPEAGSRTPRIQAQGWLTTSHAKHGKSQETQRGVRLGVVHVLLAWDASDQLVAADTAAMCKKRPLRRMSLSPNALRIAVSPGKATTISRTTWSYGVLLTKRYRSQLWHTDAP